MQLGDKNRKSGLHCFTTTGSRYLGPSKTGTDGFRWGLDSGDKLVMVESNFVQVKSRGWGNGEVIYHLANCPALEPEEAGCTFTPHPCSRVT